MIKINESLAGRSKFIDYMLYLFKVTSEETYPTTIHIPTPEFNEYIEILYTRSGQPIPEIIVDNDYPTINIPDDKKNVIVAFSGGKGSTANAAYLKDQGMNPTLYYVRHISPSYPNEKFVALDITATLHCAIVLDDFSYSGIITKAESPVKNHVILALIIEYMRQHKLTRCFSGTYLNNTLERTSTEFGLSNAYEFYKAFEKGVKSLFPNFKWFCCFKSELQALKYLVDKHPDVILKYQSCTLPDTNRYNIKKHNAEKYNITIMPNRCLSCWKCAQEHLILSQLGYLPHISKELYQHIIDVLRKELPKVMSEELYQKFDINSDDAVIEYYLNDVIDTDILK